MPKAVDGTAFGFSSSAGYALVLMVKLESGSAPATLRLVIYLINPDDSLLFISTCKAFVAGSWNLRLFELILLQNIVVFDAKITSKKWQNQLFLSVFPLTFLWAMHFASRAEILLLLLL